MTNVKKITSLVSLFTAVIIIISTIFALGLQTVNATCTSNANAFKVLSKTSYGKVYTLKSSGITIPYTDKNLKDRGTVTNGKSQKAYIENSSDLLYILNVGTYNNVDYAKVSYPSGSKRVEAYIPLSAITTAGNNSKHLYYAKALGEFLCAPRKGGALSSSYYISKGDKVYVLAADSASGNNVQIMYQTGNTWRIAYCSYTDAVRYLDGVDNSASKTTFDPIWPCSSNNAYYVTCMYYYSDGTKHKTNYNYKYGLDISGGGNIVSVESGTVTEVGYKASGFGNYVYVTHSNGTVSLYAHLKSVSVKKGQTVSKGQVLGVMGNTGGNSTGTHLHFEMSNCDPFTKYYYSKYASKIIFDKNVYSNNNKYNSDKTICNIISQYYRLSGRYYYHK